MPTLRPNPPTRAACSWHSLLFGSPQRKKARKQGRGGSYTKGCDRAKVYRRVLGSNGVIPGLPTPSQVAAQNAGRAEEQRRIGSESIPSSLATRTASQGAESDLPSLFSFDCESLFDDPDVSFVMSAIEDGGFSSFLATEPLLEAEEGGLLNKENDSTAVIRDAVTPTEQETMENLDWEIMDMEARETPPSIEVPGDQVPQKEPPGHEEVCQGHGEAFPDDTDWSDLFEDFSQLSCSQLEALTEAGLMELLKMTEESQHINSSSCPSPSV